MAGGAVGLCPSKVRTAPVSPLPPPPPPGPATGGGAARPPALRTLCRLPVPQRGRIQKGFKPLGGRASSTRGSGRLSRNAAGVGARFRTRSPPPTLKKRWPKGGRVGASGAAPLPPSTGMWQHSPSKVSGAITGGKGSGMFVVVVVIVCPPPIFSLKWGLSRIASLGGGRHSRSLPGGNAGGAFSSAPGTRARTCIVVIKNSE